MTKQMHFGGDDAAWRTCLAALTEAAWPADPSPGQVRIANDWHNCIAMRGHQAICIALRADEDTDIRALSHEPIHNCPPDALAAAGNQRGVSVQPTHQKKVFRFLDSRTFCTINTRRRSRR